MSVLFYLISILIALCSILTIIIYMEHCNNYLSINEGFESSKEIPLELNPDYLNNNVINKKPNFKLNAYCINLENKIQNMTFIENEWKDFLNITRFIALDSCTKSHNKLLANIWKNKETLSFPIVIMEDDVFRRNDFTKYWNELLNISNCDYIAFDAFYLKFKENQNNINKYFVSLKEHRATGFTVYYKKFFDRFTSLNELNSLFKKEPLDMNFTHNPTFINLTPKEQVVRQIVSKISSTGLRLTSNQLNTYEKAEKELYKL